ncbi:AAA family ATPase [Nocardia sp. 2]|uniref:AAA family ATPase n=1 Tax=Nocardia acididurans TaxID=2802282 RepID=A0ABS1M4J0_9NOCA|nr:helix-turn-helix transcriptional regulator [Nocardia acididurans]MBL1075451.1 AAA family ATPase [Nocardia acididurans]
MLYGRSHELQQIDTVLRGAREGRSGALVITGDAGVGKSALLRYARSQVGDTGRLLRCVGIESESELPFAGLHLLLGPILDRLDVLPGPQADALGGALGLRQAEIADRFLIGVATLSLLTELSTDSPVVCLIDDAQWLDQPSLDALTFAGRRLGAEGIAMVFASRPEYENHGLPTLALGPIDAEAAAALLAECCPTLEPALRDRVMREAEGNPLALIEFECIAGEIGYAAGPLPLPQRLQTGFERRILALSEAARAALLVVAAEETGDLGLALRVLHRFGHTADALAEAEGSGMVSVTGSTVTFRHPLQRSAAYHGAPFTQRLAVHAALAAELGDDRVREAWHLAAASTGPDETVAAALEFAAEQARERTGYASAAAALERAVWLTPDPEQRGRRLTGAVETAAQAGLTERALRLVAAAAQLPLGQVERARVIGTRARVEFEHGSLRRSFQLMIDAAECVVGLDPERAAWLCIEAARIAWTAGDLAGLRTAYQLLEPLELGPAREPLLSALRGPLALCSGDPAAGVAMIRANGVFSRTVPLEMISLRLAFGNQLALIGDMHIARTHLRELADLVTARGMIGWLPAVGSTLSVAELIQGRFRDAEVIAEQCLRIAADIGQPARVAAAEATLALVAAVRGDSERCRELAERNLRDAAGDHNHIDYAHFHWALALLDLGAGRHQQALDRLQTLHEGPEHARGHWIDLLADLVEAAGRLRAPERAAAAMAEIELWARALDTPWAEGLSLRCRAILRGDGDLLTEAMALHAAADRWYDHARSALLYGEFLRRERRMNESRTHLRRALETFERLGCTPWADHARTELRAAGEGTVPEPATDLAAVLTPQELQVVRLAAAGATNREIAAKLFLSPKTVGHHLYRAFPKLGVSNRVELARLHLED